MISTGSSQERTTASPRRTWSQCSSRETGLAAQSWWAAIAISRESWARHESAAFAFNG